MRRLAPGGSRTTDLRIRRQKPRRDPGSFLKKPDLSIARLSSFLSVSGLRFSDILHLAGRFPSHQVSLLGQFNHAIALARPKALPPRLLRLRHRALSNQLDNFSHTQIPENERLAGALNRAFGSAAGLGKLAGIDQRLIDEGISVAKIGRTTGLTRGRVTAFEMDNVVVGYDIGDLRFDNQIEIEGADEEPFSQGGDSGSLVLNSENNAVGLLFAGSDQGGSNGKGLTYVNPLQTVLDALDLELLY